MRYLRFVIAALIAVLIIWLIVTLFRGDSSHKPATIDTKGTKLVDYANGNSTVSVTIYGRLVGEQDRRAIRITVTPTERRLEVLSGYEESAATLQTYPNTQEAYANFLSALANYGFDQSRKSSVSDPRGVCPAGNRYTYDLNQGGEDKINLWSSSCDNTGTFAGNGPFIRQLFQQQIPNYSQQVQSVSL